MNIKSATMTFSSAVSGIYQSGIISITKKNNLVNEWLTAMKENNTGQLRLLITEVMNTPGTNFWKDQFLYLLNESQEQTHPDQIQVQGNKH